MGRPRGACRCILCVANWGRGHPGLSLHCAQYVNVVCLTAPERRTSRAEQVGNKMAAVIMLACPDWRAAFLLYDNGPFLLL